MPKMTARPSSNPKTGQNAGTKAQKTGVSADVRRQTTRCRYGWRAFADDNAPGNNGFYTSGSVAEVPQKDRLRQKSKFSKKVMLWLAVSPRGVSKPYFCKSGGALEGETYRHECAAKRLIPFIDSKHKREDVLFWPDLAPCHYARQTRELLEREGIPFVPK